MKSSRNIFPYLIVGILFFYLFHTAEHYYALSKEAVPFLGFERFDWLLSNMNQYSFITFTFTSSSILWGSIGFLLPLFLYVYKGDRGTYRQGEEQGSARFAFLKEMKRFEDQDPDKNMIFSKQVRMGLFNFRLAYNVQLNKNVLIIGLPGDGKTFTFVLPNIMQLNSSFVITDPKGLTL